MFLTTVKQVKLEVRPLFLPQLVQLTSMLKPGLYKIRVRLINSLHIFLRELILTDFLQWIDRVWSEFYVKCKQAIQTFNVLVVRVHDIYSNRILNVLTSMQEITLHTFPLGKFFNYDERKHDVLHHQYYRRRNLDH